MLVATLVMVLGVTAVALLSHWRGYRLGGMMVLPLLAIYTFREPLSPLLFVVGVVTTWGTLWAVRGYTLNYGRRVFLVAVLAGASATVFTAYVVGQYTPVRLVFDDAEVVASIFPGIAAYNLMRLDREDRVADICLMAAVFVGLVLIGVAGLLYFDGRHPPTRALLSLPTSELTTRLGIESRGEPLTRITPVWLSITLLVVDIVVYEWVRKRYDLRLVGIVVIPLLAVFSTRFEHTAVIFVAGATAVFVLLTSIHWLSLLYGRVLLGISLVFGCLYALTVDVFITDGIPGLTLFFIGLFVGIAAYNVYRVSPRNRNATLRLSAGLFVVFYVVLFTQVDIPPGGLFHGTELGYVLVGTVAIGLSALELYRLERSRPSRTALARASVFSEVDIEGADLADSPLVAESEQPASSSRSTLEPTSWLAFGSDSTDGTPESRPAQEDGTE